jgi:hypothetical protein
MLNERGRAILVASVLRELTTATIAVVGEGRSFEKPLDGPPVLNDRGEIVLRATFEGREANFAWSETQILLGGEVIDTTPYPEPASKPFGAVWTAETAVAITNDKGV